MLAEEYFDKYIEKEGQAKPVAGEDGTGKSRLRKILDLEEDLMQNVQSLAKNVKKMTTVQNQQILAYRNDFGKPNWENVSVFFSHLSPFNPILYFNTKLPWLKLANRVVLELIMKYNNSV